MPLFAFASTFISIGFSGVVFSGDAENGAAA
jgi:hypothetical protein